MGNNAPTGKDIKMPVKKEKKTTTKPKAELSKTRKPAAKKCAQAKVPAKETSDKCSCRCGAKKGTKATRVIVKFNAGWGNQLFIRGMGAGLDWQKGIPMQCMGEDEWLWEQLVPNGSVAFKVLLNDNQWCSGEDYLVNAGDSIICRPEF